MVKEFSGLCVGGPHDGKMMASYDPFIAVAMLRHSPSKIEDVNGGDTVPIDRFRYVFAGGMTSIFKTAFWVPEGKDEAWAVEVIINQYAKRAEGD